MPKAEFDTKGFYGALDAARAARKLNWKQVAEQSGVSASTLTRIAQDRRPDVDSLAALINWSGLNVDMFVGGGIQKASSPEPLAQIAAYLRADPHLDDSAQAAMMDIITAAYGRLSDR